MVLIEHQAKRDVAGVWSHVAASDRTRQGLPACFGAIRQQPLVTHAHCLVLDAKKDFAQRLGVGCLDPLPRCMKMSIRLVDFGYNSNEYGSHQHRYCLQPSQVNLS